MDWQNCFPPVLDIPAIINQRPIISGLADTTLQIDNNFNIPFTVSDADNDPVTVNIFNNPNWVTLNENSGQYHLVGKAPALPDIEYIFQIVATDGKQADGKSIKITTFDNTIILSETELKTITVYPNPASTYFVLDGLPPTSSGTITIVDTKEQSFIVEIIIVMLKEELLLKNLIIKVKTEYICWTINLEITRERLFC